MFKSAFFSRSSPQMSSCFNAVTEIYRQLLDVVSEPRWSAFIYSSSVLERVDVMFPQHALLQCT